MIATASYDKTIALWEPAKDYARIAVIRKHNCNRNTLKTVSNTVLLTATYNKIHVWNRWLVVLSGGKASIKGETTLDCACGFITAIEVLKNQKFLAGSRDGKVLVFSSDKFRLEHTLDLTSRCQILSMKALSGDALLCLSRNKALAGHKSSNPNLKCNAGLQVTVINISNGRVLAGCREPMLNYTGDSFLLCGGKVKETDGDKQEYSLFGCRNHTICRDKFYYGS